MIGPRPAHHDALSQRKPDSSNSLSAVIVSGSPSPTSKTAQLGDYVTALLEADGISTRHVRLRELSPTSLLTADRSDPAIADAIAAIADADGVVLATPTFKAAYSGLLKAFLDLLPQFGLSGKAVLPLATGGSLAHVLALDYALRPVVQSMGARHVVQSYFVLEAHVATVDGRFSLSPEAAGPLSDVVRGFRVALAKPANDVEGLVMGDGPASTAAISARVSVKDSSRSAL